MAQTAIEWTDRVWNPVTGCSKVSAGCKNCYAERMAGRLQAMGQPRYRDGFSLTTHPDLLALPHSWRKGCRIFVNSMSDLFHPRVPETFIASVFATMAGTPRHTYQILTKRPEQARAVYRKAALPNLPNVWLGTSVENNAARPRIDCLRQIDATVRFLSLEPLLELLPNLDLENIHWVIAGGESGPGARPMPPGAAADIRDQCQAANVPFFFKQWGGARKKAAGRILDGKEHLAFPQTATLQ